MTEIILTKDGSHSLLNTALNETYHSVHGAVQESKHVFIQAGLDFFLQHQPQQPISILEIGFGTGLNALLTGQRVSDQPYEIKYTSLESFPIDEPIWSKLNYAEALNMQHAFESLHRAVWNSAVEIHPNFELIKLHTTLQQASLSSQSVDIVYFDAFAPSKQPEMWTHEMLSKVVRAMKPQGVFVTYCAKGQLKRDLRDLGLSVETLAGPPGKKEMVRAVKPV